jgi:hypothetical protein
MKTRSILAAMVGLLSAAGMAQANTITVGVITSVSDGSGGQLWTYPILFNNSSISATQPTSFVLDDFGPLKTTGPLPTGWSFSPGEAFTLTTPLVGPSFGLPGFNPNNPAVADVVITFTANGTMGPGMQTFNLVLDTAATGAGGRANFFSQDIVATGDLAGSPNAAQQNITTPSGAAVPDGGTTSELLGAALFGLGLLRKKLGQRS